MRFLEGLVPVVCGALLFGISAVARAQPTERAAATPTTPAAEGVVTQQQSDQATSPGTTAATTERHRRSPAMFAGGLAMAITGGIATTVGASMAIAGGGGCFTFCGDHPRKENVGLETAGFIVLASGAAMLLLGVPLAVAGGRFDPPSSQTKPSAMLVPILGPGVAGSALTLSF